MCKLHHLEFTNMYFNLAIITWKLLPLSEAVARWCSKENVFLEISQNLRENNYARVSFLIKLQKKETLEQVLSWEFGEISKNTSFYSTPSVATSALSKEQH